MKFTIKTDDFLKELQLIQGVIERKTTIPILSNLLIRAKEDRIDLEATDLEVGLKCKAEGKVSKKGELTVNARKLFDLVRSLPEMTLDIALSDDKKNLQITGTNVQYKIPVLPAEDYPGIPVTEMENFAIIPAHIFRDAISKTIIASAIDDTRYTLNGIFTVISADGVILVATDAHRLTKYEYKGKIKNITEKKEYILPRKGAQEALNLVKDAGEEENLEFKADGNNIFFRFGERLLVSRVIEGKYPQYEKVIPLENDKIINCKRAEILKVLSRIDLVASEKSHAVVIDFQKSKAKIKSSSPEFGEGEEILDVNYDGEELTIAFNARYIIDFLNSVSTIDVVFKLKDGKTAGMFHVEGSEDHLYVVSPIKL
ncbi:MAG: DNA polymerase III subunit beta [Ignavibacteria bacterium]|nr:DNA polymerase III subunit beta [Ignavibacteria bacterium]